MSKYCDELLTCPYYPRCKDVGYCLADDNWPDEFDIEELEVEE